jgi:hypothetical protein
MQTVANQTAGHFSAFHTDELGLPHFLNGGKNERNERREVHVPARPAGF